MLRAILIANPASGRGSLLPARRTEMLRICREWGWTATMVQTGPEPGSAARLAAEAVQAGTRLVIACGGDGTVHGVLQGVAGTDAVLGVLPFGTANALARNLHLPLEPVAAMHRLMSYRAQRIPLGWAETERGGRWFAVLAGAGPDGMLVEMAAEQAGRRQGVWKARLGRSAYYARAARLFATRRFPAFQVEFLPVAGTGRECCEAVGVLASRVPNLGGLFRGLTAESRLHHPYLEVQLLRAPAQLSLPAWFAMSHLRLSRWNPWLLTIRATEVRCQPLAGRPVPQAQVDGEAAGALPLRMRVVPEALSLLAPAWALDETPWLLKPSARLDLLPGGERLLRP